MADAETPPKAEPKPPREPFSPGVLMVMGLVLVVVAAWCGHDAFSKEEWRKEGADYKIWLNGGMMVAAVGAAVYAFVVAALRYKKTKAAKKPDQPTLL